jgi:hypothetical protein
MMQGVGDQVRFAEEFTEEVFKPDQVAGDDESDPPIYRTDPAIAPDFSFESVSRYQTAPFDSSKPLTVL